MDIWYRNTPVFLDGGNPALWLPGRLVNGNTAIETAPGTYLSVQPDGTYQPRSSVGPWETCTLSAGNNTVTFAATGISYPIPINGR